MTNRDLLRSRVQSLEKLRPGQFSKGCSSFKMKKKNERAMLLMNKNACESLVANEQDDKKI